MRRGKIMRNHSIIVLELNQAVLQQLQDALEECGDFKILYTGDDGDEGLKMILQLKPDVIVVSMFLKGRDGSSVMQAVKRSLPNMKMIVTGTPNDVLIERAMDLGAAYYLVKPFSVATAVERIREVAADTDSPMKHSAVAKRKPISVEEKISEIFISIGIPPHIKGYGYLREGIRMTIDHPYVINSVTKELYPAIAKKFDTTPSKVERAIRHAIEVAWNRGRIDAINAIFGSRIYLGTEKPTNSEFIALVADKLILENMI